MPPVSRVHQRRHAAAQRRTRLCAEQGNRRARGPLRRKSRCQRRRHQHHQPHPRFPCSSTMMCLWEALVAAESWALPAVPQLFHHRHRSCQGPATFAAAQQQTLEQPQQQLQRRRLARAQRQAAHVRALVRRRWRRKGHVQARSARTPYFSRRQRRQRCDPPPPVSHSKVMSEIQAANQHIQRQRRAHLQMCQTPEKIDRQLVHALQGLQVERVHTNTVHQ